MSAKAMRRLFVASSMRSPIPSDKPTRAPLRERFGTGKAKGAKALLVAAPLEGIDLSREREFGRDAED